MKKKQWFGLIRDISMVVTGNIIYALGVALFIIPGGLITGGTTGISLFVYRTTGFPMAWFVLLFNGAMFIIGLLVLGKKFAATTAVSTFVYPLALDVIQRMLGDNVLTTDIILCTIFGGLCVGAAIGLVMRAGSSTGGMDIPPLVLHKYFKLPISVSLYVLDMAILVMQAVDSTGQQILYGILLVLVYTVVLDKCLMAGKSKMQVQVISEKNQEIKSVLLGEIDRGVTMLKGCTGYLERDTDVLLSVISSRELARVEKRIHDIDPDAFLVVSRVNEVSGRGFSKEKQYAASKENR